ncbi:MAG TPA: hypothetical protein VH044_01070 [Polyangiaceae bacterium]|nr:hypothetical protein [Polyangiaceae bacterium]
MATAGLLATACSGSGLSDIVGSDASGTSTSEAGEVDSTTGGSDGDDATPTPGDSGGKKGPDGATGDATTDDGATGTDAPTDDGATGADAPTGDDGSTTPHDAGVADAAPDASDASPTEAGDLDAPAVDDAATFACGPSKRCNAATEYCRLEIVHTGPQPQTTNIVVSPPIIIADGGIAAPYQCLPIPVCASANLCKCIDPDKTCACSQSGGDYTEDCTGAVIDN